MLQPWISHPLSRALINPSKACRQCQQQILRQPRIAFAPHRRQFSSGPILRLPAEDPKDAKAETDDSKQFIPRPLGRPIGFAQPPRAGENVESTTKKVYTGSTYSERNLQKRKDLVERWGNSYFRDFKNITKYRSGKTFMANPKIFKKEMALYFPNFHGETLAEDEADTTPLLKGKVSIVNVYSSQWGEAQARTFTGKEENPELHALLQQNQDAAQLVDVNVEANTVKAWIIALFRWNLRRQRPKEEWGKYFVVRKGISDRMREAIGLLNGRVGYVYLLDENCKIRWAGSANAEGTENEDMVRGLGKLIQEFRNPKPSRAKLQPQKPEVEEELEAQVVNAGAS